MNHWSFVIASYAVVLLGSLAVVIWSYSAMRKAERRAQDLKRTGR